MKRIDLIRTIEGFGCELVRHGGKHDWYRNPGGGSGSSESDDA
jgi:mRNA interferase HicA